jgi:aspartyl/asparaginyl-tRNA synthetase
MIEPEIAFADLSDNASLAKGLLSYTFAALLKQRQEDLAFFDERIEKGIGEIIGANVRDAIPFRRTPGNARYGCTLS